MFRARLKKETIMLFFIKVRIDVARMPELGQRLQRGELDTSAIRSTYCLQDDPSVGLNIWEAEDRAHLERLLAPHRPYYAEVMSISPVLTPSEAQKVLAQQTK
jgi:hypothetical protein